MNAIDCRLVTIFELELFFEKARIRILDGGEKIEIYEIRESDVYSGELNYQLSRTRQVDYSQAMMGLYDNVFHYLEGKQEIACTLEDGVQAVKICRE